MALQDSLLRDKAKVEEDLRNKNATLSADKRLMAQTTATLTQERDRLKQTLAATSDIVAQLKAEAAARKVVICSRGKYRPQKGYYIQSCAALQ